MKTIVFATKNKGKLKEIQAVLADKFNVISMQDAGIDTEIEENGKTFEENSLIKARAVYEICKKPVLADDSGLEIDYLDKKPGVHSARYMGEDTSYDIKNSHILDLLKDVPDEKRSARFVCVISYTDGERELSVRETVEGIIGHEIKGENGFGYDPIFYLPEFKKTSAELSLEEKNKISHRGKALARIKEMI